MKNFSIFEEALKLTGIPPVESLGRLSNISRRDFDERETFVLRTITPSLEYASLMVENTLLLKTNRNGRVYAGFGRLSALEPVIGRYLRIADVSECVTVFGQADWVPPSHPNIRIVALEPDLRLAREWFLLAYSSTLCVALVSRDEEGLVIPPSEQRVYSFIKSSNPQVVRNLVSAAECLINLSLAA